MAISSHSSLTENNVAELICLQTHRLDDIGWRMKQKALLAENGALVLSNFLHKQALSSLQKEAQAGLADAYFNPQTHTVYLSKPDPDYDESHIRNRQLLSSKGCICDDQIADSSVLKQIYHHPLFQSALCDILGEEKLYPYADSLSSVNIHYARKGEELNWHYDNSSFAVTLMISPATKGGHFEYVQNVRKADDGDMGFEATRQIIDGETEFQRLSLGAGDLCLFRGRNALHRVSPVEDNSTRQLAVLAYNSEPGISLSSTAQQTFYGRIGSVAPA